MSRGIDRRKYTKEFKLEAVALCRQPGMSVAKVTDQHLYDELGLVKLTVRTKSFSWAKA